MERLGYITDLHGKGSKSLKNSLNGDVLNWCTLQLYTLLKGPETEMISLQFHAVIYSQSYTLLF